MNDDAPTGDSETPVDPELQAGFNAAPHRGSVLEHMKSRIGGAPKVTLHADEGSGGAPLIDPGSAEKLALPQGRGTYQLLGEIAQGGMGVILKGHDVDLGRDVAVKVLHKDLCERPEVLQRFVEEAQIGGQLQHPGIVPVYELGLMADERPYFTMKLVKGRTLATLIAERESPQEDRRGMLDVFGSICQTMAYAHSRGVIHRDLKPANVMVGAFGEVQVVDWGLAKVLGRGGVADERKAREARADMTILETVRSDGTRSGTDSMVGSVMGTPAYMPPEQAQGKVDKLDERSDVFSLGAILCEILTGSPPYGGEQEKTLFQAAQAELDPALERLETCDADPELVKLTQQCLMPAPTARPRNAGVLAERIRRHLESLEERTHAAQVEAAEARVREVQARKARRLTLALAAAVLGLVVTGGGAWMWTSSERATREREEVNRELAAATRERALAGDVDDALSQASLLRGQAQWTGALAAVDRALGLAEGGGAGDALLARIESARADVRRSADEARAQAERKGAAEELTRELQEAGRVVEFAGFSQNHARLEAEYDRVFTENDLDIDAMTPGEVADAFLERGLGPEVAAVLDTWIWVRNTVADSTGGLDAEDVRRQALHLADVAREVDPDPVRGDLRRALIKKDVGFLVRMADSDLSGQPPTTLALLGTALELVGWRDKSLRVLRDGVYRHPDVFELRMSLVQVLLRDFRNERWNQRTAEELVGNTTAALGLRPQNTYLRVVRYWQLRGLGTEHLRHGQVEEARESMYEAARLLQAAMEASSEPFWRFQQWIANGLLWSGRHEEALAVLRSGQEAFPDRAEYYADIANCLFEMRRFDDAIAVAEAGLVAFPGNLDLLGYLLPCRALSHVVRGDVPGALEAVDAALPRDPDDRAFLLNNIGWFSSVVTPENLLARSDELSAGERERAIEALRKYQSEVRWIVEEAVEIDPRSGNIWNTLGIVRYRGGDMQGAIEAAERSLELGEVGFECLDRLVLAMAHHQLGNEQEAMRQYERSKHRNEGMSASSAVEMPPLWAEAEALLGIDPRRR